MKKGFLAILAILYIGIVAGQEVGIRFGGVNGGGGAAIDGVFDVGGTRIHADVGFYDAFAADLVWDLIFQPVPEGDNFYWYLGPGVSTWIGSEIFIGGCGEIGLEYRFVEVPVVIGVDWRPTLWIIEQTQFDARNFGLNVRWNFGE